MHHNIWNHNQHLTNYSQLQCLSWFQLKNLNGIMFHIVYAALIAKVPTNPFVCILILSEEYSDQRMFLMSQEGRKPYLLNCSRVIAAQICIELYVLSKRLWFTTLCCLFYVNNTTFHFLLQHLHHLLDYFKPLTV